MRRLVLAALLLVAFRAFPASVTVGCPGGTPGTYPSINAALAALDNQGPHTITVTGTCTESVLLDQRERLTIQAPTGQTATINGTASFGIQILNSGNITLRNLAVSAPQTGIAVANKSAAAIAGVTAQGGLNAIDIFGGATANLGGFTAADAVLLHNSTNGMRIEGSVVFFPGFVTAEDNSGAGIFMDSGRLEILGQNLSPLQGGPNIFRGNFVGISISNGAFVQLSRYNLIENNDTNGILALVNSIVHLMGGTVIQGNPRSGVAVLFNSTLRSNGANTIQNNGSANDAFRSGVSASHNSMVWFGGGQIINNTGRGILTDSGATVRLDNSTVSGNSDEGLLLQHGAILESIGGNTVPANGSASVTCDATTVVFGDFTGFAPFECAKKEKEK